MKRNYICQNLKKIASRVTLFYSIFKYPECLAVTEDSRSLASAPSSACCAVVLVEVCGESLAPLLCGGKGKALPSSWRGLGDPRIPLDHAQNC